MLLYVLAKFCIASTTAYIVLDEHDDMLDDRNQLSWEEAYSVEATRVSFTSGVELDYKAWKTKKCSRIDYNHESVTEISIFYGENRTVYRVRPETTNKYTNKIVCREYNVFKNSAAYPTKILPPHPKKFKLVGDELVDGMDTTHFKYVQQVNSKYGSTETVHSVWAISDNSRRSDDSIWIPVKYEISKYNKEMGALLKHHIWTYYNYDSGVDDSKIFDYDQFDCNDKNGIKNFQEREKFTNELPYIDVENEENDNNVFGKFKTKFNRNYAHEDEHQLRERIFRDNMRLITETNEKNLTYKLGINQFSDWTTEELEQSLGYIPELEEDKSPILANESDLANLAAKLPKKYDMRILGLVSPVKDQDKCGSCWAFAAAAVMESCLAKSTGGKLLSLSEQAIMDCAYDISENNNRGGCKGGNEFLTYKFIRRHGIPKDEEYGPYKSIEGYCNIAKMKETYKIKDYKFVYGSSNALKVALVNHGALYARIKVSRKFHAYSSGVFTENHGHCDKKHNHCGNHVVAIVGYGKRNGRLYWIIKNSWATTWGMDGYMLLDAKKNSCKITRGVSYPVV